MDHWLMVGRKNIVSELLIGTMLKECESHKCELWNFDLFFHLTREETALVTTAVDHDK